MNARFTPEGRVRHAAPAAPPSQAVLAESSLQKRSRRTTLGAKASERAVTTMSEGGPSNWKLQTSRRAPLASLQSPSAREPDAFPPHSRLPARQAWQGPRSMHRTESE